ncbi:MAG: hypothetical protein O2944_02830 [Proteobacteria bacterium]|nr:hypothetical protein [Pseudomonadota bacterium]
MVGNPDIGAGSVAAGHVLTLKPVPGQALTLPGGGLLSNANFFANGNDLLIELSDGSRIVVQGYFSMDRPPALATEAGAHVAPDIVAALAGVDLRSTPLAVAQPVAAPIGRVEHIDGEVFVIHPNGSRVAADAGMLIGRGDRFEIIGEGHAGFLFADETTFSLGANGKAVFEELLFDPGAGVAKASFIVQQGAFSFTGGAISHHDGGLLIKTPAASITVDRAAGAGWVEPDGATTLTYLQDHAAGNGSLVVWNPTGRQVLNNPYQALNVDGYFEKPSPPFRLTPRDAAEHFGDPISVLPDAAKVMPESLLGHLQILQKDVADAAPVPEVASFQAAAERAAIAHAARDAADAALADAGAAEQAARAQAAGTKESALAQLREADALKQKALDILQDAEQRDAAFEEAIRKTEAASIREGDAAHAVAETELAESRAAEKLSAAEEAVRRAIVAADEARNEALQILDEARAKEAAFEAAQTAARDAKAHEDVTALAVAEADAAEAAAAVALQAAEAAAYSAARDAELADRVAHEARTAAQVVEIAVQRELASIDPDLLRLPSTDNPASIAERPWTSTASASIDIADAAFQAGEAAAKRAFADALAGGASTPAALEKAIEVAAIYGGGRAADRVLAGGVDKLLEGNDEAITIIAGTGAGLGPPGTTLAGGGGADAFGAGAGYGGVDGLFGFGFRFTPIDFNLPTRADEEDRNDQLTLTVSESTLDSRRGSSLADFIVGTEAASVIGGLEGDDYIYGDTPTNYLAGTHGIGNTLTSPTFGTGGADLISGGAGADHIWGGGGADRLFGDNPTSGDSGFSEFGFGLGTAGSGADIISGGDGNDTIWGGGGADQLSGDGGDDTFMLGDDDAANDTVWGGDSGADSGTDTADYSGAGAAVSVDLAAGTGTGSTVGTDTLSGIENITGSDHDDTLSGDGNANNISGGAGSDTISGRAGADNLFGYAGDDVLIGGEGADQLWGGRGADTFRFEGGTGATTADKIASLGLDIINDYNATENDLFELSNGDFALGAAGTLSDGTNYFEAATTTLTGAAQNLSGGVAAAGIVIIGDAVGSGGVGVYYTSDASAMTTSNSYQIADVKNANLADLDASTFHLKS